MVACYVTGEQGNFLHRSEAAPKGYSGCWRFGSLGPSFGSLSESGAPVGVVSGTEGAKKSRLKSEAPFGTTDDSAPPIGDFPPKPTRDVESEDPWCDSDVSRWVLNTASYDYPEKDRALRYALSCIKVTHHPSIRSHDLRSTYVCVETACA